MIYAEIKDNSYDKVTVEEAEEAQEFASMLNYLVDEGFVEMEVDDNGEPRFYPVS